MSLASNSNLFSEASTQVLSKRVILLSMLFVSFLITSNLTAFKIAEIHLPHLFDIDFPAALIFFPLTYFFDDVLTEVYGFKISRLVVWGGLICSALVTLCLWAAVSLPVSPTWDLNTHHGESAYELIFTGSIRVFIASTIAYFFGEFINSIVLAKLKVVTQGNYLGLRIIASTLFGVGLDSVLFINIAYFGIMPTTIIWKIVATIFLFKVSYEIIMLPITYRLINYLKKTDKVDYFDRQTKFNPFSLSLKD